MVAIQTSSTIYRGADWDFSFQIQSDGPCSQFADISEWIITPTLTTSSGVSLTTPAVVKPMSQVIALRLNQTQTAALAAQFGAQLVVNVQRPDGWDMRLIEARVTIC